MMKKCFRSFLCLALSLLVLFSTAALADVTRVAALKGPTGMGLAHLMSQNDPAYDFSLVAAPTEMTGMIINGSVDIAAVPTNLASVLYAKTKGEVKLLALNTLGVLYILEKGDTIQSIADLHGRTIVTSGQGALPEYVLHYILSKNNIGDATVEWRSEHSEVNSMAASGMADIIMVPEPYVTALLAKDDSFHIALDITEEFAKAAHLDGRQDTVLSMGCVVVRADFFEKNPDAVAKFMDDCKASIDFANENPEQASQEIADNGIMANKQVALSAIPKCHLVFISGEEMKNQVAPLFEILLDASPASVGGALPKDDFYYKP